MDERENLIKQIERLPAALAEAVSGLSDKQLDTPTGEGKWTMRQLTHHIADANMNACTRMKLIITENKPILKPYDQDQWSNLTDCKTSPIDSSLILIKGLHARWTQFMRSLPESSWTREGIHLENGKVTLFDLLKTYSKHGDLHLQHIVTFRTKMKW